MTKTVTKKEIIDAFEQLNDHGKTLLLKQCYNLTRYESYAIQPINSEIVDNKYNEMIEKYKREEKNFITATVKKPDYILLCWRRFPDDTITAYYLPEKEARFVYVAHHKIVWQKEENGAYKKVIEHKIGFSRWSRKEITEEIRQKEKEYEFVMCAPMWLLTSIPDPRPRYLYPENEEA